MQRKLDVAMGLVHRPRCSSWTSRPPGWTPRRGPSCGTRSPGWPRDEGLTILLTTHYLEEADRLADQLAIVDRGRVVAEGIAGRAEGRSAGRRHRVELATASAGRSARSAPARLREVAARRAHRCAPGPTTAPPPCPRAPGAGGAGIDVASVTVARPSLDDVYLRHAGRAFEQSRRSRRRTAMTQLQLHDRSASARLCCASPGTSPSPWCSRSSGCCCSARCSSRDRDARLRPAARPTSTTWSRASS